MRRNIYALFTCVYVKYVRLTAAPNSYTETNHLRVERLKLHLCMLSWVCVYYNVYLETQHAPFNQICKVNHL